MNFQKIALKIAYWLVALSIVVLIGFTFYAHHVISSQSKNTPVKKVEIEETSNIQFSGMSLTIDNKKTKKEAPEIEEAVKKDEGVQTDQN